MKKLIVILLIILLPGLAFSGSIQEKHLSVIAAKNGASIPDGEIGSTCSTCGSAGGGVQGAFYYSDYTPTTAGNIRYLRIYTNSASGTSNGCLHIWDNTGAGGLPGNDLGYCTVTTTEVTWGWKHCDIGHTVQLTADTTYYLGVLELAAGDQNFGFKDTNEQGGAYHVDYDSVTGITTCIEHGSLADDGDVLSDKLAMHADMNDQDAP